MFLKDVGVVPFLKVRKVNKTFIVICAFFVFLSCVSATAGRLHRERDYQVHWCAEMGGTVEYVLPDRTRVDCLTDDYAVEVDFAGKWAEAVGQALYYGKRTNKRPGIVLIMESDSDGRFLKRLMTVSEELGIRVWTIGPEGLGEGVR